MDRRFLRASLLGAAAALLLCFGLLTFGHGGLLAEDQLGGFYEAQARALFDGHVWVDPAAVAFEGFDVGDRTYIYQGPVPAILRMPVLAVTSRFDGRLTRISMLAAFLVALGAIVRLAWQARVLVRGRDPVGRFEAAWTGVLVFGAGASSLLFLGAKPWVYHEALLWGAAFALASFAALVRWLVDEHRGWHGLAWAAGLAGLALLTRPSVGAGPILALGLVGLKELVALRHPEARTPRAKARVAGLLLGAALPLVAYGVINQVKFGSPFKLPTDAQVLVSFDKNRQRALKANNGSLFGLKYAPSVLWQTVRPDAVAPRRVFPFIGFPNDRPDVIGDVVFAERDWSSSIPASEPMLVVLGLVGVVALVVPDRVVPGTVVRRLRLPVLGAAAGGAGVLVLGYMANRYLSDVLPLVVLTGVLGSAVTSRWLLERRRGARLCGLGVLAVLALWGAYVNTSLGLQYQREIAPGAPGRARAEWLDWQARLGPDPRFTRRSASAPLPAGDHVGRVVVIGKCGGVYRSTGGDWQPIEGGPAVGRFDLDVSTAGPVRGTVPLVAGSGPDGEVVIGLAVEDGRAHLAWRSKVADERNVVTDAATFPLGTGDHRRLRIIVDWRIGYMEIRDLDAHETLFALVRPLPHVPVRMVAKEPLVVRELPPDRRVCDAIGAG